MIDNKILVLITFITLVVEIMHVPDYSEFLPQRTDFRMLYLYKSRSDVNSMSVLCAAKLAQLILWRASKTDFHMFYSHKGGSDVNSTSATLYSKTRS